MQGSCARECLYDRLDVTEFYKGYVPSVLEAFLASEDIEAREAELPGYSLCSLQPSSEEFRS